MSAILDTSNLASMTTATNSTAVLAFTDEGPKKLPLATIDSFRKLRLITSQGQTPGWIRLGKFDTEGEAIVLMFGRWGAAKPQTACLVAQCHINGDSTVNKVCNLLAATSDSGFSKARLVKTSGSNSLFLDVYMANRFSQMYFTLLDAVSFTQLSPAFAPELEATQSTFESSLLQVGGVIYCTSIRSAEKGGQHERIYGTLDDSIDYSSRRVLYDWYELFGGFETNTSDTLGDFATMELDRPQHADGTGALHIHDTLCELSTGSEHGRSTRVCVESHSRICLPACTLHDLAGRRNLLPKHHSVSKRELVELAQIRLDNGNVLNVTKRRKEVVAA